MVKLYVIEFNMSYEINKIINTYDINSLIDASECIDRWKIVLKSSQQKVTVRFILMQRQYYTYHIKKILMKEHLSTCNIQISLFVFCYKIYLKIQKKYFTVYMFCSSFLVVFRIRVLNLPQSPYDHIPCHRKTRLLQTRS